jgi:hypothetical protein
MMGDYYRIRITNPDSVGIPGGPTLQFASNEDVTALAEDPTLETAVDLWNAGGPYSMQRIADDPWLAAMFFRLCRAKVIQIHAGTGEVHANRRKQSTAASHEVPEEVRHHPA